MRNFGYPNIVHTRSSFEERTVFARKARSVAAGVGLIVAAFVLITVSGHLCWLGLVELWRIW